MFKKFFLSSIPVLTFLMFALSTNSIGATPTDSISPAELQGRLGYYTGMFKAAKFHENKNPSYTNKITISIDSLQGGKVKGHSIVAGNQRPFNGSYSIVGKNIVVKAKEPGDDKYDGVFNFTLVGQGKLNGQWSANNKNLAVYLRKYQLNKRVFKYDPTQKLPKGVAWQDLYATHPLKDDRAEFVTEDVLKVNPSTTLLKKEDVENMHKGDLEIIRNSIYARHGYSFKNRKIRYVFDTYVAWYFPLSTDVRNQLTSIEVKNISLIKRYEQHAKKYYDTFGR